MAYIAMHLLLLSILYLYDSFFKSGHILFTLIYQATTTLNFAECVHKTLYYNQNIYFKYLHPSKFSLWLS